MMAMQPESPLTGYAGTEANTRVSMADCSLYGTIHIEGKSARQAIEIALGDAPLAVGSVVAAGGAIWIGQVTQTRFILTTSNAVTDILPLLERTVADAMVGATTESLVTITDQSHGHGGIWVGGEGATDVLSKLCGLDFSPDAFPINTVKMSSLAKIRVTIWHLDEGWLLHVGRSYTRYLWETLLDTQSH